LLRLSGLTLQEIGNARPASCTREAVRTQVQKAEKAFGFCDGDLVQTCEALLKEQQQQERVAQLRQWIQEQGRLPLLHR
jgi:hypothetical protein